MTLKLIQVIAARNDSEEMHRVAGMPEVGIWWLFNGELITHMVPFKDGQEWQGMITDPVTHLSFWRSISKLVPGLADRVFSDLPRGRVNMVKDTKVFELYGPEAVMGKHKVISKIIEEFHLPSIGSGKIELFPREPHYQEYDRSLG